jgi:hypothetical protein
VLAWWAAAVVPSLAASAAAAAAAAAAARARSTSHRYLPSAAHPLCLLLLLHRCCGTGTSQAQQRTTCAPARVVSFGGAGASSEKHVWRRQQQQQQQGQDVRGALLTQCWQATSNSSSQGAPQPSLRWLSSGRQQQLWTGCSHTPQLAVLGGGLLPAHHPTPSLSPTLSLCSASYKNKENIDLAKVSD